LPIYGITLNTWNMNLDADPVIGGTVGVTNSLGTTQHYTLIFSLPVAPVPFASITGGNISGSFSSLTADGVTVASFPGTSMYTATIDGSPWQTLYPHPQSFFAAGFGGGNIPYVEFGGPIPSLPGPAVLGTIGIILDFTLTSGDQASFTSNFVVVQGVPEPKLALLLVPALLALGLRRSR
jgi:hypothetical protein